MVINLFKYMKKFILPLFLLLIFFITLIYDSIRFYFNITKEIINLNSNLAVIASNFYTEPTSEVSYKDVVYKSRGNLDLTLDIYSPKKTNKGASPVIIYVFGDSWMYGNKNLPSELSPIIEILRNEGFTIISTSYELLKTDAIFDKQISDIKDTIRWIYKNKDIYNFDTDNIGIVSPSAGSQLSMIAAFSDNNMFIDDLSLASYPSNISYIVDLFGPTELSKINISLAPTEVAEKFDTYDIENISELYSPINYVKEDLPNTLIIHSIVDTIVPYSSSLKLFNESKNKNNNFELLSLETCTHYLENLSTKEAITLYFKILSFIYKNSKN